MLGPRDQRDLGANNQLTVVLRGLRVVLGRLVRRLLGEVVLLSLVVRTV